MSLSAEERARLEALVSANIKARGPVRRRAGVTSDARRPATSDAPRGVTVQQKIAIDYAAGRARAGEALEQARNKHADKQERLEAARAAVEALPVSLERLATLPVRQFRQRAGASLSETARAVVEALERGRSGHFARMGNRASYVQQEDLDDVVHDGWGLRFGIECSRLARAVDVPPKAIPLLVLLTWVSELRPTDGGRQLGVGGQFSIEWLSRKLGCSTTWTKHLMNRLDPQAVWRREKRVRDRANRKRRARGKAELREPPTPGGRVLMRRFRRLGPYASTPQRGPVHEAAWVDADGVGRTWVDVRGVCYSTDAGRALLVRQTLAGGGKGIVEVRPALHSELRSAGYRVDWKIRGRLKALGSPVENPRKKNTVFRGPSLGD